MKGFIKILHGFLLTVVCLSVVFCPNTKEDDLAQEQELNSMLIAAVAPSAFNQANCETSATSPAFSTLAASGTSANCESCHTGASAEDGFDITDYASVIDEVTKGAPNSSGLYLKVTVGSMAINSTDTINQAIYDWIAGCAAP